MAIYPCVNAAVSNEVAKFRCKCSVQDRAHVLCSYNRHSWQMMSNYYDMLSRTLLDCTLQEPKTFLMFKIEVLRHKPTAIILNLAKVIHPSQHVEHIHFWNL